MRTIAPEVSSKAPPIRAFPVQVHTVRQLSQHFRRITFRGADLARFGSGPDGATLDLRIKLVIPAPGRDLPDFGCLGAGWYQQWLGMDPVTRGSMRTYTVRSLRRSSGGEVELDVDFVLHPDGSVPMGPAGRWAATAMPGSRISIIGPNADSADCLGIEFRPGPASRLLLAGDETAVPAIAAILEALPDSATGHAVLEVQHTADFLDLTTRSKVKVQWLARGDRPFGDLLQQAVAAVAPATSARGEEPERVDVDTALLWETPVDAPDGSFYAWVAGEAATVRAIRRYLVRTVGVDRQQVAFMGYWRQGVAERS